MDQSRRDRFSEIAPGLIEPLRRFLARRTDPDTAEDVLAEVLLVCWRQGEDLPAEPLPWAYGVARNCLRNAERSARRQPGWPRRSPRVDPPRATAPGPESADPGDGQLADALAGLRPEDAELLRLWAWEQLSPAEIGTVLDISPNAASIRLHRARQKLGEGWRKIQAGAGHEESREG